MIPGEIKFEQLDSVLQIIRAQMQLISIRDNQDPLVEIPRSLQRYDPHPYQLAGAPYGAASPFFARQGLVERLLQAHNSLESLGFGLKVFDAYRPLAVQEFMVQRTFQEYKARCQFTNLSDEQIMAEVYTLWAPPDDNPKWPTPHSTGGAIDLTLFDLRTGEEVNMGSEIDEAGPPQMPNHFAQRDPEIHRNRMLLRKHMCDVGFAPLLHEWWHFSFGDRFWAYWQETVLQATPPRYSIYGRYDLLDRENSA